jgi:hypothetical protein
VGQAAENAEPVLMWPGEAGRHRRGRPVRMSNRTLVSPAWTTKSYSFVSGTCSHPPTRYTARGTGPAGPRSGTTSNPSFPRSAVV